MIRLNAIIDCTDIVFLNKVEVEIDLYSIFKSNVGKNEICQLIDILEWIIKNEKTVNKCTFKDIYILEELFDNIKDYKEKIYSYNRYLDSIGKWYLSDNKENCEIDLGANIRVNIKLSELMELYCMLDVACDNSLRIIKYLQRKEYVISMTEYFKMMSKMQRFIEKVFMGKLFEIRKLEKNK